MDVRVLPPNFLNPRASRVPLRPRLTLVACQILLGGDVHRARGEVGRRRTEGEGDETETETSEADTLVRTTLRAWFRV